MGGGAGSGKVSVQDLSVTKYIDSSSAPLMLSCCNGAHFTSALLTVRNAGGKKPVEYVKINLQELMITSVKTGGSGGDDRLTENVSLNFVKVKVEYLPQEAKGGQGNMIPFSWDIAANDNEV